MFIIIRPCLNCPMFAISVQIKKKTCQLNAASYWQRNLLFIFLRSILYLLKYQTKIAEKIWWNYSSKAFKSRSRKYLVNKGNWWREVGMLTRSGWELINLQVVSVPLSVSDSMLLNVAEICLHILTSNSCAPLGPQTHS